MTELAGIAVFYLTLSSEAKKPGKTVTPCYESCAYLYPCCAQKYFNLASKRRNVARKEEGGN